MDAAKGATSNPASREGAMLAVAAGRDQPVDGKGPKAASMQEPSAPWYAIWTNSHCEQLGHDQLAAKGFELFFPKTCAANGARAGRRAVQRPLFPGYLFVQRDMDKTSYIEIVKARGVVRVLGERWDALAPIPHEEIDAIRRVIAAGSPVLEHPHLTCGDRARITSGPLAGVSGIFLRSKPSKGLLVLSIDLLRRSVALEVPATLVQAI
jgi:transcription antitermination factor NusG